MLKLGKMRALSGEYNIFMLNNKNIVRLEIGDPASMWHSMESNILYGEYSTGMRLKDFIQLKCADIAVKAAALSMDAIPEMFSYDALIDDGYGGMVKVIYDANNNPIQIADIIGLTVEDFQDTYKFDSAMTAFQKYMSAYKIVEGEDLYRQIQLKIENFREAMLKFENANLSDLQSE